MTKTAFWHVLVVGAGGFVGSALRFLVSGIVHRALGAAFPWGTLAVNALGCLAIGFFGAVAEGRGELGVYGRLFLLLGVLGGFTTFSTFAYESLALAQDSELLKAAGNTAAQLILGFGCAFLGHALGRLLAR